MQRNSETGNRLSVFGIIAWVIFLLSSVFILVFAATPGSSSSQESSGISQFLASIINFFAPGTIHDGNMDAFHSFVRKAVGHFGLFAFTGVWGYLAFAELKRPRKYPYLFRPLFALCAGLALAIASEAIQRIPSLARSGEWKDVGIDIGGYASGVALTMLVYELICFAKRKKAKAKTH